MSDEAGGACLSKWYLDCIGPHGEAFVGYHVELTWKALTLRLAGYTVAPGEMAPSSRLALRGIEAPIAQGPRIVWAAPGLQLEGRWAGLGGGLDARLFEGPEGAVDWRCFQPVSRVQLRAEAWTMEGLGYAEQLVLTLPPWRLPIAGLRWGRFVAEGHAVVWIDWEGAHRCRLLAHNGRRLEPGEIGEARVASADGTLQLELRRHSVLREAKLGETLGEWLPRLPALPRTLLGLEERKWIASGELRVEGQRVASGWVIHERVTWPASAA